MFLKVHKTFKWMSSFSVFYSQQRSFIPEVVSFLFSRHLRQEKEAEKSIKELEKGPKLDLGFKEGQTIRINISVSASYVGSDPDFLERGSEV